MKTRRRKKKTHKQKTQIFTSCPWKSKYRATEHCNMRERNDDDDLCNSTISSSFLRVVRGVCLLYTHSFNQGRWFNLKMKKKASSLNTRRCYGRWKIFERFPRIVHQWWCCYESFRWLNILFFFWYSNHVERDFELFMKESLHEFEYGWNISCNLCTFLTQLLSAKESSS